MMANRQFRRQAINFMTWRATEGADLASALTPHDAKPSVMDLRPPNNERAEFSRVMWERQERKRCAMRRRFSTTIALGAL